MITDLVTKKKHIDKWGEFLLSVMKYGITNDTWAEIDKKLKIDLIRSKAGVGESGIKRSENKFSKFSYTLSEHLIEYFTKEGDRIIDPFMGWGIRGVVAIHLNRKYMGFDISPRMYKIADEYLGKVKSECLIPLGDFKTKLEDGTILASARDNAFDFCLTCPPYWDIEKYDKTKGQLSEIREYDDFIEKIGTTFKNVYRKLKNNTYAVFVVADVRKQGRLYPMHSDFIKKGLSAGFKLHDIIISEWDSAYQLFLGKGKRDANKISCKVHEYILVFKKVIKNE